MGNKNAIIALQSAGWQTTSEASRRPGVASCCKAAVHSACLKQAAIALPDTTMVNGTAALRMTAKVPNASSQSFPERLRRIRNPN